MVLIKQRGSVSMSSNWKAHNQAIKFAPCGRRTLVPCAVYGGRYASSEKRNLSMRNCRVALVSAILLIGCAANPATSYLSSQQLVKVLVGNTEFGHYQHKGYDVSFSQYYSPDGKITGDTSYGPTTGIYEIREDGCFYTDFFDESGVADGCNYYTEIGENQFRVDGPYDSVTEVSIKIGDLVSQ